MFVVNRNKEAERKIKNIWQEYLENKTENDYTTLYIHVPFCIQKCNYCEYCSKITHNGIDDSKIDYLEEQFLNALKVFKDEPIKAINFGGGTPNILSPKQLERILNMIKKHWNLKIDKDNEMGFEFHPALFSKEHLDVLQNSYINRLSMGIQTFDKNVLKAENRLYVSEEQLKNIYNSVKNFSKIVNVDLLAGLIGQTSSMLSNDVKALLDIGVESLTIYELNRVHNRRNIESKRANIIKMLVYMYEENKNNSYRYVGTTNENNFIHCNRFYKNKINTFKFFYNPAPQNYNNVIAFSLDDNIGVYPYSHFISINKAYQRLNKYSTSFYNLCDRFDRPIWVNSFKERTMNDLYRKK